MFSALSSRINLSKITLYAIIVNSLQILAALAFFGYAAYKNELQLSPALEKALVGALALLVMWGGAVDIREAFNAKKIYSQRSALEDAYSQLEALNATLRAQRHDFMNHIQVVYSLTEMGDTPSAMEYLDKVYGDISKVGRVLKTAIPAVNALLAAKTSDCERRGIGFETNIESAWQGMNIPGWEMCRVLGNLIDNAIDAIGAGGGNIKVELTESVNTFGFSVENDGAPVPANIKQDIFKIGFSTKNAGRGMGLHIVSEILKEYGGGIALADEAPTRFIGTIPKK